MMTLRFVLKCLLQLLVLVVVVWFGLRLLTVVIAEMQRLRGLGQINLNQGG